MRIVPTVVGSFLPLLLLAGCATVRPVAPGRRTPPQTEPHGDDTAADPEIVASAEGSAVPVASETDPEPEPPSLLLPEPLPAHNPPAFPMCGFERRCRTVGRQQETLSFRQADGRLNYDPNYPVAYPAHEGRVYRLRRGTSRREWRFIPPRIEPSPPEWDGEDNHSMAIEGFEGRGRPLTLMDHGGRIHLVADGFQALGPMARYAYFDGVWHVSSRALREIASLGVDRHGQPWFLFTNGVVQAPDGRTYTLDVRAERATWAFTEDGVYLFTHVVNENGANFSLLLSHISGGSIRHEQIKTDPTSPPNTSSHAGVLEENYLPLSVIPTTEGLMVVYQRNERVGRVRCRREACNQLQQCDFRDCYLGQRGPFCTTPGTSHNTVCEVTTERNRASLIARRVDFSAAGDVRETVLVRPRWASTIHAEFSGTEISITMLRSVASHIVRPPPQHRDTIRLSR